MFCLFVNVHIVSRSFYGIRCDHRARNSSLLACEGSSRRSFRWVHPARREPSEDILHTHCTSLCVEAEGGQQKAAFVRSMFCLVANAHLHTNDCHNVLDTAWQTDLRPPQLIRRFTAPVYIFNIVTPLAHDGCALPYHCHCSRSATSCWCIDQRRIKQGASARAFVDW